MGLRTLVCIPFLAYFYGYLIVDVKAVCSYSLTCMGQPPFKFRLPSYRKDYAHQMAGTQPSQCSFFNTVSSSTYGNHNTVMK